MDQSKKKFTVAKAFTDAQGKSWQAGQDYTGTDQNEIERLEREGSIKSAQGQQPGQQAQGGQQGQGGQQAQR